MLVDRHHVQYLIELGHLGDGKPAQQLTPHKGLLDTFLRTLLGAAAPEGRDAFTRRMQRLPVEDRPWSAVRSGNDAGSFAPPAALLVLSQVDDDPDSQEDGNRLPDRAATVGGPWARLHEALDRWDTAEILRWVGPLGWQPPRDPNDLVQEAEPCRGDNHLLWPVRSGAKEPRS